MTVFLNKKIEQNIYKIIFVIALSFFKLNAFSQQLLIEELIVETYYITDSQDAAFTTFGEIEENSTSFRVYLDLCAGCKFRGFYASANHPLSVNSTENFYNSTQGGTFGNELNHDIAMTFGIPLLDSYFSFGPGTAGHRGILKVSDPTSVIISATLQNQDPAIGVLLTESDGLEPSGEAIVVLPPSGNSPSAVFNNATVSNSYFTDTLFAIVNTPTTGLDEENKILIGQFTTTGTLEFELNVIVEDPNGTTHRRVASNGVLSDNEQVSAYLKYPPQCGCTDSDYLEYDPSAPCDDGSCETFIMFGCTNPDACNFDPEANFSIPELCCFVDSCQGLDPNLLCPTLSVSEKDKNQLVIYPNPATSEVNIKGIPTNTSGPLTISIFDLHGRCLFKRQVVTNYNQEVKINSLLIEGGMYLLRVDSDNFNAAKTLIIRD